MQVTNGDNLGDLVYLQERLPLIKAWVLTKQLLQSPIKNFGLTNLVNLYFVKQMSLLFIFYL